MPRHHSPASSGRSGRSSRSSGHSYDTYNSSATELTSYSFPSIVPPVFKSGPTYTKTPVHEPLALDSQISPRSSALTYASTVAGDEVDLQPSGPTAQDRSQVYAPDAHPATSTEFAALFPTSRRLLIQHDDTTLDGNMNIRVDAECTTRSGLQKKVTLFHLKMKDLKEREFSLRRYCRDSGREVASSKKRYIKSTSSTPRSRRSSRSRSLLSGRERSASQSDPGRPGTSHLPDEEGDDEEDERKVQAVLAIMTAPQDQVIKRPTSAIQLEFSNYAQIILERRKTPGVREYGFEYWGDLYKWKRERHLEDGEEILSYDLVNTGTGRKLAIVMPDALSAQEAAWESRQGGWIPASSMRLLRPDISDDLGDVIMATGLLTLTDDCLRRAFRDIDHKR